VVTEERRPDPVLITDAPMSYEQQLATRKSRYKIMMAMRIPLMIAAAACYQFPWVAVALLVISIPLPWMAVLSANDRLPKKIVDPARYRGDHQAIEAREHTVVDEQPDQRD
jgi:hypothetical protein